MRELKQEFNEVPLVVTRLVFLPSELQIRDLFLVISLDLMFSSNVSGGRSSRRGSCIDGGQ